MLKEQGGWNFFQPPCSFLQLEASFKVGLLCQRGQIPFSRKNEKYY